MKKIQKEIEEKTNKINLICQSLGLAMGIAVVVLSFLGELEIKNSITMLGIGLFAVSLSLFTKK